jgi:hypothetical protein
MAVMGLSDWSRHVITQPVTRDNLNAIMSFDHPIRVHDDGTVTDGLDGIYAPTLCDDELDDSQWEFFSTGYTGQYGYRGPIMHNSEFIGGRLADDILSTPGVYAAVVADWSCGEDSDDCEDSGCDHAEGWAVVRLIGSEA